MNSENTAKMEAKKLYQELETFFNPNRYEDFVQNGVLADNTEVIHKVYTATFSSSEVLEKLRCAGAHDCLLFTHHPGAQHPESEPPAYFTAAEKNYMKENHISHYSLHLPMDQLNPYSPGVSLAKQMGLTPFDSFFEEGGSVMGVICTGSFRRADQVLEKVETLMGHKCRLYEYGGKDLKDGRIAIAAGGAEGTELYETLKNAGVTLFVTGVGTKEADWFAPSHEAAAQAGVSILAAGHYSTEKFALMAMCEFFRERGIDAEFIEETPLLTDM